MDSIGGVSFPLIPELPLRRGCDLFAYNWDNDGPDSSGSLGMVADVTIKNLDFSLMLNSSSTWLKTHDDFWIIYCLRHDIIKQKYQSSSVSLPSTTVVSTIASTGSATTVTLLSPPLLPENAFGQQQWEMAKTYMSRPEKRLLEFTLHVWEYDFYCPVLWFSALSPESIHEVALLTSFASAMVC